MCYIASELTKFLLNHSYQEDEQYYYHFTNLDYGKAKWIWIFKRDEGISWFNQVDNQVGQ